MRGVHVLIWGLAGMIGIVAGAGANAADEPIDEILVVEEHRSVAPSIMDFQMRVPAYSIEHQVRLELEARIESKKLNGSNPWIRVWVNDNPILLEALVNKPNNFTMRGGVDLTWFRYDRWRVLYSPDFKRAIEAEDHPYGVRAEDEPYRFVWDITPYVRPGMNALRIEHVKVLANPSTLVLRDVKAVVGRPVEPKRTEPVAPVPTGPVPTIVAGRDRPASIVARVNEGGMLTVGLDGEPVRIGTRIAMPAGKWQEPRESEPFRTLKQDEDAQVTWEAGRLRIERRVRVLADHVEVDDTLTNTAEELVGVMIEHMADPARAPDSVLLAGRKALGEKGVQTEPAHPSAYAQIDGRGLGLVAEDDVFRVHVRSQKQGGRFGIADHQLGLEPGDSITLEWSVFPVADGDYWTFVNRVRRAWEVNIQIPGPFTFNSAFPTGKPAEFYINWMRQRDMKMVCGGIAQFPNGKYAHGTGINFAPKWVEANREWTVKMRQASDLMPLAYFHAQISTEPNASLKYEDSRLIDGGGEHVNYPYRYPLPIFLPTNDNSYGKALWSFVNALIDQVGVRGIYWDELAYSVNRYAYDAPWDGRTVIIDPRTHGVTGKRTSVPLVTQPLRLQIVDHIRDKGLFLMANGQAMTRTMLDKDIVRFIETGTYSALITGHLACPLGLGNHHAEDSQAARARHVRDMLEYGAVYHGHYYHDDPAAWNFQSVMYPITPTRIGPGFVLGEQRIHAAVSGRFGWPDGAEADVYVVDAEGNRVAEPDVKRVENGGGLYEIRMPGDHFAILVRKDAADR